VSVDSPEQLEGLRRVGRVVAETIAAVRRAALPGVTTGELDALAQAVFDRSGARSGPVLTYAYPGAICLSVGDEIVHGRAALAAGIRAAVPGATLRDLGAAVERATEARGFRVARELTGHGIGRRMHEPPTVSGPLVLTGA
jgi:methionyl aminopeptidase